jgi:transcriptional regulator with XRE-family HTH domain
MAEPSLNSKIVALGVSKSYASQLAAGIRVPSLGLALKIYRSIGVKLGPLAGASKTEIAALEKVANREGAAA